MRVTIWKMRPKGSGWMADVQRVYRPYWEWEDHEDGMYGTPFNWMSEIQAARELLVDSARLEPAMQFVVDAWPNSAEHQLSNMEQNRRAWVGQAACRFAVRAAALATRAAWAQLTDSERNAANACAERVIHEWEEDHAMTQTLFGRGHA